MRLIYLKSESGQASAEYVIALFVGAVMVLALGALFRGYGTGGGRPGSATSKTLGQAPYSAPTNGEGGILWAKDLLMH